MAISPRHHTLLIGTPHSRSVSPCLLTDWITPHPFPLPGTKQLGWSKYLAPQESTRALPTLATKRTDGKSLKGSVSVHCKACWGGGGEEKQGRSRL